MGLSLYFFYHTCSFFSTHILTNTMFTMPSGLCHRYFSQSNIQWLALLPIYPVTSNGAINNSALGRKSYAPQLQTCLYDIYMTKCGGIGRGLWHLWGSLMSVCRMPPPLYCPRVQHGAGTIYHTQEMQGPFPTVKGATSCSLAGPRGSVLASEKSSYPYACKISRFLFQSLSFAHTHTHTHTHSRTHAHTRLCGCTDAHIEDTQPHPTCVHLTSLFIFPLFCLQVPLSESLLTLPLSFPCPQGASSLPCKCFPLSCCHSNLWAGRHDNYTMVQWYMRHGGGGLVAPLYNSVVWDMIIVNNVVHMFYEKL